MKTPMRTLMICNTGNGFTAGSRVLVRKSQNILGQKKPSTAAAIWSILACQCLLNAKDQELKG